MPICAGKRTSVMMNHAERVPAAETREAGERDGERAREGAWTRPRA